MRSLFGRRRRRGAAMVEYFMIAILLVGGLVALLRTFGDNIDTVFQGNLKKGGGAEKHGGLDGGINSTDEGEKPADDTDDDKEDEG